MPLFGRSRKRNASTNDYSTVNLSSSYPSPPPPYHTHPLSCSHQHTYSDPGPYSHPAATTTNINLVPTYPLQQQWTGLSLQPQAWASHANLPNHHAQVQQYNTNSRGFYDYIGERFGDVVSLIDEEVFPLSQRELIFTFNPPQVPYMPPLQASSPPATRNRAEAERSIISYRPKQRPPDKSQSKSQIQAQQRSVNVLSKVSMYSNSRLPPSLPPLRLYMASWPLVCRAAEYSRNAYKKPIATEKNTFVNADIRLGTKAMVIKSVPLDDSGLIIFAIRGTSLISLRDWNVNMSTTPVSPAGFLSDPGNLCHEGFLRVARAMTTPIAARLRQLLQENPSRTACSLLITGHSAGGAVASLLYSHMLAESKECQSELNILTGCFKRIHCITFGGPPVSLLPLWKPAESEKRLRKSLFLSFINEGDVVCRAEKAYVRSLIDLIASPPPDAVKRAMVGAKSSRLDLSKNTRRKTRAVWKVPPATLSNAGRLVVLRVPDAQKGSQRETDVSASIVTDAELRGVVFGDPLVHTMDLYAKRVEVLATKAVMGQGP